MDEKKPATVDGPGALRRIAKGARAKVAELEHELELAKREAEHTSMHCDPDGHRLSEVVAAVPPTDLWAVFDNGPHGNPSMAPSRAPMTEGPFTVLRVQVLHVTRDGYTTGLVPTDDGFGVAEHSSNFAGYVVAQDFDQVDGEAQELMDRRADEKELREGAPGGPVN